MISQRAAPHLRLPARAPLALRELAAACVLLISPACTDPQPQEAAQTPASPPIRSEAREWTPGANEEAPPTARADLVEEFRAAQAMPRHPSDGGGRAWLEPLPDGSPPRASVASPGRFELTYEAGPLGIAVGGMLYLQVDPFWDWSSPQAEYPQAPGYTLVETDAEGVSLEARALGSSLLAARVEGRALQEGERVRILYGAGPRGARTDRYRDRSTHLWIAVDGDGDGMRSVLADSPTIDVDPGPAAQLVLRWPSTAQPGEEVRVVAAVLDRTGSTGVAVEGELVLKDGGEALSLPRSVPLELDAEGRASFRVRIEAPGIHRLSADLQLTGEETPGPLSAQSNPLVAHEEVPLLLWADLHGHSNLSDGTGTPEDYFTYARDVAGLDVVALTDHDHWGVLFIDENPQMWEHIQETVERFHAPGEFVTLLGYEWTSWIHGHRHVLYFTDRGELHSSLDPATDSPADLWDALRGEDALTFAHHSAGGPIATNWSFAPDPILEPVTEVVSVHGVSEAAENPGRIYSPRQGYFVRDALNAGYRLGFIGSGDSHDGHPGLAHLASPTGGVAAVFAEERTRASVLEAFRARRVYATSGPRIFLNAHLAGLPMGSDVPASEIVGGSALLEVRGIGTGPIGEVELIRSGAVTQLLDCGGEPAFRHEFELHDLKPDEYVYINLRQEDRAQAWSSPWFIR